MKDFERYSQYNFQFHSSIVPPLVQQILKDNELKENTYLIDIGCGDGVLLLAIVKNGYLSGDKIVGFDISKTRLKKLKKSHPNINIVQGDACNLFIFKPHSFNIPISSQVIEHIHNQDAFLSGIYSLLRPCSYFYISSVIKGRNAFWIYRNNGQIVLDPTHVHEFKSKDEFVSLLEKYGFLPITIQTYPVKFGLMDCIIRSLIIIGLKIENAEFFFINHKWPSFINKIKIPVPGYFIIEGIFRRS